jgi:hypothetical protein
MKIVDFANEIYINEGSPTWTSLPAISYWLRAEVGRVNNLIFEDMKIDDNTLEIVHCDGRTIDLNIISIFKQLYRIYSLQLQVNNQMNNISMDSLVSVEDSFGGVKYTRLNRNEISKTLILMRKDEMKILDQLISAYQIRQSTPRQVAGDDTISAQRTEPLISLRNV